MSKENTILVLPGQIALEVHPGRNVFQTLAESGISLNQACGGKGICGKCKVIFFGRMPPPSPLDEKALSPGDIAKGMRLACGVVPIGGEVVELLTPSPVRNKLEVTADRFPVHRWPGTKRGQVVLAVDLGTTNIVGLMLDPFEGLVIGSAEVSNGQAAFGADVMTRLAYASEGGVEARKRLKAIAFSDLKNLCSLLSIRKGDVAHVIAVMNSAMETFLLSWNPDCLGRYPCEPEFRKAVHMELSMPKPLFGAKLHIPPVVGGYVGSDTVAALQCILTARATPPFLLIDIGTNAESLLVSDHGMVACSSASGPAFEGGSISCGMRACDGAIEEVLLVDGQPVARVIGGQPAKGIAGSGLFSLLGELVKHGGVDAFGMLQEKRLSPRLVRQGLNGKEVELAPRVSVSEGDIQQFILAKASARAGLEVLLETAGLKPDDLTNIFLCGTFAGRLRVDDVLALGLVPEIEPSKIVTEGNAAAKGAAIIGCSSKAFQHACALAKRIRHLRLSGNPKFSQIFQEHIGFESLGRTMI